MEFPRHLHKPEGLFVVVQNEAEYEKCAANGWALLPPAHVEKPVQVALRDAIAAEESADDEKPKGKPGRKPKAE